MTTYTTIDDVRGDDRIDSRDLIELRDNMQAELEATQNPTERDDLIEAINAITELEDAGLEDWQDGASLIREDTFEDYARELAEDIGAISGNEQWPLSCIDWEQAARELSMDYTSVDFLGFSYYTR